MKRWIMILAAVVALLFPGHPGFAQTGGEAPSKSEQKQGVEKESAPRDCPPARQGGLLMLVLDRNKDGKISASEIENAPNSLKLLDRNGDGMLDKYELRFFLLKGFGQGYDGSEHPTGLRPLPDGPGTIPGKKK
ncbi:MAG: hypothetical protein GY859_41605 [Desulfobacterales bacterium]|nr:hypothetical protein [Desulfobacterales bacterium]